MKKIIHLSMSLALSLSLLILALVLLSQPVTDLVLARVTGATLYVAPNGNDTSDCTNSLAPCANVQYAVDQADFGSEIHVATGTYTGVNKRPRNDITTTGFVTQMVYISKTVSIRGGYTTAFTAPPNPATNPTTLDAQGQGRVLYITGDISPTVEGLSITGGDAIGLGGNLLEQNGDAGGGVYIFSSSATVSDNKIFGNTANGGGGVFLLFSKTRLIHNSVNFNSANGSGGGLLLAFNSSSVLIVRNTIISNTAGFKGGGIDLEASHILFINNLVANNHADSYGSGLYISASSPLLLHTTLARNSGGDGSGIFVTNSPSDTNTSLYAVNSILVSHTAGITVTTGNTATLVATLWGSGAWANGINWGGAGSIVTGTVNVFGDPDFVDPASGDYHIAAGSAAIDRGLSAGANTDLDNQLRPYHTPDLGADEYWPPGTRPNSSTCR